MEVIAAFASFPDKAMFQSEDRLPIKETRQQRQQSGRVKRRESCSSEEDEMKCENRNGGEKQLIVRSQMKSIERERERERE